MLQRALTFAWLVLLIDTALAAKFEPRKPNVVILLADDLGYEDVGCYGGPVHTGAIDRLRLVPNLLKPEKFELVDRSSIEKRQVADVSSMPTGLLDTFTPDEIMDLLAFLQTRGGAKE